MTSSRQLQKAIKVADNAFGTPAPVDERETGFESDELPDEAIQTRRACRALRLADALRAKDYGEHLGHKRFYSAAIELAFQAIERTCQAVLINCDHYSDGQKHSDHAGTLAKSHRAGIWDEGEAEALRELYESQRAKTYYDDGIPSESRANAMVDLAHEVHGLAVAARLKEEQCICEVQGG